MKPIVRLGEAAKRGVGIGLEQLPDMRQFPVSLANNGWCKLPNGLIFQWGIVPVSGIYLLNFTIPFPNAAYSFSALPHTTEEAGVASVAMINGYIKSKSQAYLLCARATNGSQQPYDRSVYWHAIGC
ncbi:phage tail protein [Hafnia alvei]|uniref:gp53-like domain-containing protein n=1 Tax=Hafnia alvei TaxID=569 RepID=UPI002DB72065|nr:phage tail protein [Hafnia alvei]MEB7892055.1 phage tail protein [Hafnia alvei]